VTSTRNRSVRAAGALLLLGSVVASGCSSDEPTASTENQEAEAREYDFSAVDPIVEAFLAENDLDGAGLVVVDEDEGIVGERYFGEFDADRVSLVASASKMVTAGVLVRLADQGELDLDQPIAEYVDWAQGQNPDVTVAQLLSNSSGFVGLLPQPAYGPYVCQFLPTQEIEDCAAAVWTTPADDADVVPPDTEYRYGGVQWQIAGAVAETVSGKSWPELLEETYVEPCGVESMGYSNHWTVLGGGGISYPTDFDGDTSLLPETGNPHMEGGLYIDPVDYAELLLMQLRDGRCGETQVLEPESVERMHTDRIGEAYDGGTQTGTGYGFGWWVARDGSGRITDPGAYGAVPWLDLDGGFGAYLVIEADGRLGAQLAEELFDPVESAVTAAR
jgi:CubicO group peptidase (beta-lactamase class C family)